MEVIDLFLVKHKLKKMFIPMLIILKLFKLKLLLFLPFILGITGLKKILGLGALVIPGNMKNSILLSGIALANFHFR